MSLAGLEPAIAKSQVATDGDVTESHPGTTSTSDSTPVAAARIEAAVREILAAGTANLPRNVRAELARLLGREQPQPMSPQQVGSVDDRGSP